MVSKSNSGSNLALLWAMAGLSVWFTYNFAIQFSAFAFGFAAIVLVFSVTLYIDRFMIPQFDTFDKIKESPVAIAIYWTGLMISAAIAMLASR